MRKIYYLFNLLAEIRDLLKEIRELISGRCSTYPASTGQEKWLDACDVMSLFHIGRTTLYKLKKERVLVPLPLGRKDMYRLSDIERTLAERLR